MKFQKKSPLGDIIYLRSEDTKISRSTTGAIGDIKLTTGDIEIGAVEIKDSTTDTRATVGANGLHVDVQASVLPDGASTSAKQLADGHNVAVSNMIPAVETGLATSAKQLADGHNVTIDNISTDEVYVRGGGTAGSAVDGEVVTVQGIAGATAIPVSFAAGTGLNGGDVSVGTTEVEMTFAGTTKSVQIQSKVANTGSIWVGLTGVTNVGANAFTQLSPGQSVSMDLNDASAAIFAISDVAAQTVYKVGLT